MLMAPFWGSCQVEYNPHSTVGTQWSITGAATSHEATDEGQPGNDATDYVWDCSDGQSVRLGIEPVTDSGVDAGWVVYTSSRCTGTADSVEYSFQLREGGSTVVESWSYYELPSIGYNYYSHTIDSANMASVTDFSDLQIWIQATRAAPAGCFIVSQVSLEAPAVSASLEVIGVGAEEVIGTGYTEVIGIQK